MKKNIVIKQKSLSILIRAEEGFSYITHPQVNRIEKYLQNNTIQIYSNTPENLYFKHKSDFLIKTDRRGSFDINEFNLWLKKVRPNLDLNSQIPELDVTLIGGNYSTNVNTAFMALSFWWKYNSPFEKLKIRLPYEVVFDVKDNNFPYALSEIENIAELPTLGTFKDKPQYLEHEIVYLINRNNLK